VNRDGIKYKNLFDFINSKAISGEIGHGIDRVSEAEFQEALRSLENDYVLNLIGHKAAPTIRFIVDDA